MNTSTWEKPFDLQTLKESITDYNYASYADWESMPDTRLFRKKKDKQKIRHQKILSENDRDQTIIHITVDS